jgi:predicted GNAT family acetyltransferase
VPLLAERLRAGDIILPGVMSTAEMADAVAAAWRRPEAGIFDTRLYSLDAPPPPGAARGVLRAAAAADIPLLRDWATAFFADVGLPSFEGEAFIARLEEMIAVPRLWLWDDDGPVCMVAHTETTPRTARIGPVYTPPGLRGKGYATAAVAALTRGLLAGGRTWCVLFADVANPTATELYRRLGYEEVCLFREYRLGP